MSWLCKLQSILKRFFGKKSQLLNIPYNKGNTNLTKKKNRQSLPEVTLTAGNEEEDRFY